jgi:short-subunit dehydrogenase
MQTVLVTGAGGGIGCALVRTLLAGNAYRVIAVTRPKPLADDQALLDNCDRLVRKSFDLSSYSEMSKLEAYIAESEIELDWLIIAHGFIDNETVLEDQRPEDIFTTFQINILSVIYMCQLFLRHVSRNGGIICVSSTAGLVANGRYAAYSASKAAVNNFMQALARNRPTLSFFTVCAGPTRTPMLEKIGGNPAAAQDASVVGDVMLQILLRHTDYKSGDIIVVRDGWVTLGGGL